MFLRSPHVFWATVLATECGQSRHLRRLHKKSGNRESGKDSSVWLVFACHISISITLATLRVTNSNVQKVIPETLSMEGIDILQIAVRSIFAWTLTSPWLLGLHALIYLIKL